MNPVEFHSLLAPFFLDDDCDDDELEPGEGEAVWEEEEVEGGIEIVEECPDDEDDGTLNN